MAFSLVREIRADNGPEDHYRVRPATIWEERLGVEEWRSARSGRVEVELGDDFIARRGLETDEGCSLPFKLRDLGGEDD